MPVEKAILYRELGEVSVLGSKVFLSCFEHFQDLALSIHTCGLAISLIVDQLRGAILTVHPLSVKLRTICNIIECQQRQWWSRIYSSGEDKGS